MLMVRAGRIGLQRTAYLLSKRRGPLFVFGISWLILGGLTAILRLLGISGVGVGFPYLYLTLTGPAFLAWGIGIDSGLLIAKGGGVVSLTLLGIFLFYFVPGGLAVWIGTKGRRRKVSNRE